MTNESPATSDDLIQFFNCYKQPELHRMLSARHKLVEDLRDPKNNAADFAEQAAGIVEEIESLQEYMRQQYPVRRSSNHIFQGHE